MRGPIFFLGGVPVIRIVEFWSLYGGPPISGNYDFAPVPLDLARPVHSKPK